VKKYALQTVVGVFVAAGLACVAYLTVELGHVSFLAENTYPLYARFTTVSGLKTDAPAEIYGIKVGRVAQITLDQQDQMAVLKLSIQDGVKIYDDAIASIETRGLLGEQYVSISPGGAGALLKPGGTIIQTQPPVNIYDLLSKYIFGSVKK
jgi:phospholipid/cholesterol/gamma-HCH transport system substrate-binding protein